MKKDNAVLILGGILLGFGQLARENYGFVYGAGSEGFGYNSITVLMYTWGFWAVYKMIKIFIESRSQKSEEKIDQKIDENKNRKLAVMDDRAIEPLVAKKGFNTFLVFIPAIALLIIAGLAGGIYSYKTIKGKDAQIRTLITKVSDLETQKTGLQTSLSDETRKARGLEQDKQGAVNVGAALLLQTEVLKKIVHDIASEFDNLDSLILSDDTRNIAIVDWLAENGKFFDSDGSLTAGTLRYEDWQRRQKDSDKEYRRIKASVNASVEKFGEQMETLNNLDLSPANDASSQIN